MKALLADIHARYHYDFRGYARASLTRRVEAACVKLRCASIDALRMRVSNDERAFLELLQYLTVQASDMFRDATFYKSFRETIVPVLATYPSFKIWIAGCSTGEEVDSFCIILREEGLLDRALVYATDISPRALEKAQSQTYGLDRMQSFTANHEASGAKTKLRQHYEESHGHAVFDRALRKNVVVSDHSLATDTVFAEVHVVSCRNVLIYFDRTLQERAVGLMRSSLVRRGFLGLGSKETLRFLPVASGFREWNTTDRWYQRDRDRGDTA